MTRRMRMKLEVYCQQEYHVLDFMPIEKGTAVGSYSGLVQHICLNTIPRPQAILASLSSPRVIRKPMRTIEGKSK